LTPLPFNGAFIQQGHNCSIISSAIARFRPNSLPGFTKAASSRRGPTRRQAAALQRVDEILRVQFSKTALGVALPGVTMPADQFASGVLNHAESFGTLV
jgi:hypothetical protein